MRWSVSRRVLWLSALSDVLVLGLVRRDVRFLLYYLDLGAYYVFGAGPCSYGPTHEWVER